MRVCRHYPVFAAAIPLLVFLPSSRAQVIGCSLKSSAVESSCAQTGKTLGDAYNDAGFTREIYQLVSAFGVRPGFFSCLESSGSNAFALPDSFEPGTGGTVFLGIRLAKEELGSTGQFNNFTLPAILAHEVGHIVQFQNGNGLPVKLKELQADYLSGWYMGRRDPAGTQWSETSFSQGMNVFFSKGDKDYRNPDHHGTPKERMAAFMTGLRSSSMALPEVYQTSYKYVSLQAPPVKRETQGSFQSALSRVISAASANMQTIKGSQKPPGAYAQAWEATVTLPGAQKCQLLGEKDSSNPPSYSCTMQRGDEDGMRARYTELVQKVEMSLGSGWRKRATSSKVRPLETLFGSDDCGCDVKVYITRPHELLLSELGIDVEIR